MNKNRLEAFSDGVFAIVITLLVLDIHLPEKEITSNQTLLAAIQTITPNLLTFVFTFLVVAIFWVAHHRIFNLVKQVDAFLLYGNIFYLLTVAIIPFPASLLAKHPGLTGSIIIYSSILGLVGLQHFLLLGHIRQRPDLQNASFTRQTFQRAIRVGSVGPCCYAIAILTSFISPYISFVFILVPLIFYIGFASALYARR